MTLGTGITATWAMRSRGAPPPHADGLVAEGDFISRDAPDALL